MSFALPAFETGELTAAYARLPAFVVGEYAALGAILPAFQFGEQSSSSLVLPGIQTGEFPQYGKLPSLVFGEYYSDIGSNYVAASTTASAEWHAQGISTESIIGAADVLAQWNAQGISTENIVINAAVIGSNVIQVSAESTVAIVTLCVAPNIFFEVVVTAVTADAALSGHKSYDEITTAGLTINVVGAASASYKVSAESIAKVIDGIAFIADYWDGWAYNLNTEAPSFYEQFKFNSFARIGNEYYGMNSDGICKLTGYVDGTEDINVVATTGKSELGDNNLKVAPVVYAGARSDREMLLTARVDNNPDYTYEFIGSTEELAAVRVKLGRGLVGRYWAFELLNQGGAYIEVDSLDIPAVPTSRRV